MSEERGLQKTGSRVAAWGNRAEVREIAQRVQLMAPGGKRLNEGEALALAQGAISHGLDPFNGEIWFIPGAGLMAGIKGLRKAARQQIRGNFWTEFEEIVDPDQRQRLMIPDDALAFRCILRDSETILAYSDGWAMMSSKGIPAAMIPQLLGDRPYVEGIGYFKRNESSKMSPAQVAMKRAEADALKRRFDLPFVTGAATDDEPIDGQWSEAIPQEDQPPAPSESRPISPEAPFAEEAPAKPANGRVSRMAPVTAFWQRVRDLGLSREDGQRALQECGGSFEEALRRIKEPHDG